MTFKVLTVGLFLITSTSSLALESDLMRAFPVKEQVRLKLWYEGVTPETKDTNQLAKPEQQLPIELIHPLKKWNF